MLDEQQLIDKYNIVFIDRKRYYLLDLVGTDQVVENATPFCLETGDKTFFETSWKQLLIEVCKSYLAEQPYQKQLLLDYKSYWNGKPSFSEEPSNSWYPVGCDLYLLSNKSALHACWLLRDLLIIFGVNLSMCKFVIHRPPGAEPIECREFYEKKIKNDFRYYYNKILVHSPDVTEKILRNIDFLNTKLAEISSAYDNFYLIEDTNSYANYKVRLLEYLKDKLRWNDKQIETVKKVLTILADYFKATRKDY